MEIQEQETRKMDGRIGKLLLHVFFIFIYVAKKVKLYLVQVAKSRSYISWSSRLEGACRCMRHLTDDMFTNSHVSQIKSNRLSTLGRAGSHGLAAG